MFQDMYTRQIILNTYQVISWHSNFVSLVSSNKQEVFYEVPKKLNSQFIDQHIGTHGGQMGIV